MAIITTLAIKISTNIGELLKGTADIVYSLDNIAKSVENATPSMKNLL
jgi:hypothetical protein